MQGDQDTRFFAQAIKVKVSKELDHGNARQQREPNTLPGRNEGKGYCLLLCPIRSGSQALAAAEPEHHDSLQAIN